MRTVKPIVMQLGPVDRAKIDVSSDVQFLGGQPHQFLHYLALNLANNWSEMADFEHM